MHVSGQAWWSLDVDACVAELRSDAAAGLSGGEAARRLTESGPNELQAARRVSPWVSCSTRRTGRPSRPPSAFSFASSRRVASAHEASTLALAPLPPSPFV